MAAKISGVLSFKIVDGPPELEFLYSFARRGHFINLELMSVPPADILTKTLRVYIDGLEVSENGRIDPPPKTENASESERGNAAAGWKIKGHFWGDGQTSWSSFEFYEDEKIRKEFLLWRGFKGFYNRRTRQGFLETINFREQELEKH